MPTATKFNALGVGNGFPFCLSSSEISHFDKWTTLSGFSYLSGGSPTDEQIAESLTLAMKIFWNLYSVTFNSTSSSAGSIGTALVEFEKSQSQPFPDPPVIVDSGEYPPMDRACFGSTGDDFDRILFRCEVSVGPGSTGAFGRCRSPSSIVRMLNNGEFIGYGLGPAGTGLASIPASIFYSRARSGNPPSCEIGLSGAISNIVGNSSGAANSAISNVLGFYGIGAALASDGGIATGSVNPANLLASSSTASQSVSVQISSVEYYTY